MERITKPNSDADAAASGPADLYAQWLAPLRLREQSGLPLGCEMPELELQARWFAGHYGNRFVTRDGRAVEILEFGCWNHEAGPDFSGVVVRFDGGPPQRGHLEIDREDRDWERHGHGTDPAYNGVVLHVVTRYGDAEAFTRTREQRHVPQTRIAPEDDLPAPSDLPAARPGRCSGPIAALPFEETGRLLRVAARHRFARKSARLAALAEAHGRDEALFQALAACLGYRHNALAFTLLAQRLPLRALRAEPDRAEALLFGVAGFLGEIDLGSLPPETRPYVRGLWETWWAARGTHDRLRLAKGTWKLGNVRPANHPQRRVAALAALVRAWPRVRVAASGGTRAWMRFCAGLRHEHWDRHCTLASGQAPKPMALVGGSRAREMIANVILPFLPDRAKAWEDFCALPRATTGATAQTAAIRLLGWHPERDRLTASLAAEQGLIQIYQDFCLRDCSGCAACPFPEQLTAIR